MTLKFRNLRLLSIILIDYSGRIDVMERRQNAEGAGGFFYLLTVARRNNMFIRHKSLVDRKIKTPAIAFDK